MRTALYILAGLIAAGLLVWLFIIRPAQKPDSGIKPPPLPFNSDSEPPNVTEHQLALPSLAVKESDVSEAANPSTYFSLLIDTNVNSYNIHTTTDKVKPLIHFVTSFNKKCPPYIWYNYGLYSYLSEQTDAQGNKTCYYKFDKSVLPDELKIRISMPPYQCSQFKYYLSGIEYKFKEAKVVPGGIGGAKYFCIYEKQ